MSRALNSEKSIEIFDWEKIEQDVQGGKHTYRAKVPGGWMVRFINTLSHPQDCDYIFLSDPKYTWGNSEVKDKE
jgi:hypothetical protein